jgi:hypothetical protein
MLHADALERIQAAVAAPGGLTTLVADPSPDAVAVREHVRGCAACTAEWRAWSVVSLGLAAAAPEGLTIRPTARDGILGAILARPRPATMSRGTIGAMAATGTPMTIDRAPIVVPSATAQGTPVPGGPASRPSVVPGGRTGRTVGTSTAAGRAAQRDPGTSRGSWFRWLTAAAAVAILVFVAGAAFGRLGSGGNEPAKTSDLPRILAVTAGILEGQGYSLAQLQTPDGTPGGFVAVSPGSGDLTVITQALTPPPEGVRYVCLLDRDGEMTKVGYMKFDGDVAYWANTVTDPVDLGLSGDRFLIQLETPGSVPALTGTF